MTPSHRRDDRTYLAIETSCDETCAAVVRGRQVLSNVVASQVAGHARFGGVVPEVASRMHLEMLDHVVEGALAEAAIDRPDAIAVTRGPGLVGALLVGLAGAKARAWAWSVPLVPVDHLVGHVASALIEAGQSDSIEPPFLCLLVSGGHTLLLDVDEDLGLTLLGTTRDDAAGEAFDKGARLLGLGMPGGPAIERLAAGGDPTAVPFTPAMVHHDTLDTSFAGIKTALAVELRREQTRDVADVAAGFQEAIIETLAACVRKALRQHGPASTGARQRSALAVVGGVAANARLRSRLASECDAAGVQMARVPLPFCPDNAAMIGVAAAYHSDADPSQLRTVDAYATSSLFSSGMTLPKDLM